MTIILTNDDGIDAPGIHALRKAVAEVSTIVAPNQQYSGCGASSNYLPWNEVRATLAS